MPASIHSTFARSTEDDMIMRRMMMMKDDNGQVDDGDQDKG